MSDRDLRALERQLLASGAVAPDPSLVLRYRRAQAAAGALPPESLPFLELCVDYSGNPWEDALTLFGWVLNGDLEHGSWVKTRAWPGPRARLKRGTWACVQLWRRGLHQHRYRGFRLFTDSAPLAFLRAGLTEQDKRRGLNRWVTTFPSVLWGDPREAFRWLAENLTESWPAGVGSRIWQLERRLRSARRRAKGSAFGPGIKALEIAEAKLQVDSLEQELASLRGEA